MPDQTHPTTPMAALLPSPSRCGTKLDPYEIVGYLGAGGMSEVYRAVDTRLGRQVALKTLRPALDHEEDDEVLLAEARAMAKLSHPHVVTVHEVDLEGSVPYVVMELVEGETARGWLRGGRTWREIVALYAAAGRGLHAAHEAGLVHRDFKPDNVLVGKDGRVRVSDFGLAGLMAAPGPIDAEKLGTDETVRFSRTMRGTLYDTYSLRLGPGHQRLPAGGGDLDRGARRRRRQRRPRAHQHGRRLHRDGPLGGRARELGEEPRDQGEAARARAPRRRDHAGEPRPRAPRARQLRRGGGPGRAGARRRGEGARPRASPRRRDRHHRERGRGGARPSGARPRARRPRRRRRREEARRGPGSRRPAGAARRVELALGRTGAALADARRGLAIREKALAPTHPELGVAFAVVGSALLFAGKPAEAVAPLLRALPLVARATPRELGRTRFDLARALGRADARSIPLARQARAELAAAEGAEARVDLSEVDAWLAKR